LARTIRVEGSGRPALQFEREPFGEGASCSNFGKEGRPQPIITKVSQEKLAEMIGTTQSRVSFFMNKFRKLGFISYNGTMEVHSSLLSVVLSDRPHITDKTGAPEV
jgi:CRP/FNR family transcriptional regulator, cyclic AMP receptor protein